MAGGTSPAVQFQHHKLNKSEKVMNFAVLVCAVKLEH